MLRVYYINGNADEHDVHEVHAGNCGATRRARDLIALGEFRSDEEAFKYAREHYSEWNVDGCYYCCPDYHTDHDHVKGGEC